MLNQHNTPINIAIFDLDKTITRYDTYVRFLMSILYKKPQRVIRCMHLPMAILVFKFGLRNNSWLKETFLSAFAGGLHREDINALSQSFVNDVLTDGVYADALEQIERHKLAGDRLVLASASFNFYVDLLGAQLGFNDVICTQAEWDENGCLTGSIDGKNCYAENKLAAVEKHLPSIENKGQISMYSDHDSDLPVFLLSDIRIATNPNSRLDAQAARHGISVVRWQ